MLAAGDEIGWLAAKPEIARVVRMNLDRVLAVTRSWGQARADDGQQQEVFHVFRSRHKAVGHGTSFSVEHVSEKLDLAVAPSIGMVFKTFAQGSLL